MTDPRDLIGAAALGALDADEWDAFAAALAADPELSAEFDRHLEVAAALAGDAPAPDHLWSRIAADLGESAPVASLAAARTQRRSIRFIGAVAAAAVAASALLAVQVVRQRSEISDLRTDPLAVAVEETRDRAGTEVVAMTGSVDAEVVLAADGTGYLLGDLPDVGSGQTYQLWAVVDDRVLSAGILGSAPGVSAFHVDGEVTVFALTVEMAGGVVVSEQEPVSVGTTG